MPFMQRLSTEAFWLIWLRESIGIKNLNQDLTYLQPMNGWKVRELEDLFGSVACEVQLMGRIPAHDDLDLVVRYPGSFQGRGLMMEDLTTQGLRVLLRKPADY